MVLNGIQWYSIVFNDIPLALFVRGQTKRSCFIECHRGLSLYQFCLYALVTLRADRIVRQYRLDSTILFGDNSQIQFLRSRTLKIQRMHWPAFQHVYKPKTIYNCFYLHYTQAWHYLYVRYIFTYREINIVLRRQLCTILLYVERSIKCYIMIDSCDSDRLVLAGVAYPHFTRPF